MELDTFRNGAGAAAAEQSAVETGVDGTAAESTAHVVPERGVFVTSQGNEIELSGQTVSALMLERITNEGRPKIPRVEVTLLGKHKELQANPNDPGYVALLKEWEGEQNVRVMRYLFCVGTKGSPPSEFTELHRQFMPDASDLDIKYLWVSSRIPDKDIERFTDALIGQFGITAKGIDEAANFSVSG